MLLHQVIFTSLMIGCVLTFQENNNVLRNAWNIPEMISEKDGSEIDVNTVHDAQLRSILGSLTSITQATNTYLRRLHNKKGSFLAISKGGKVYGVPSKTPNTIFLVLVYNKEIVRLQNVKTKKYIAVSCKNRKVIATLNLNKSSLLKYKPGNDSWERFQIAGCEEDINQSAFSYLGFTGNGVRKKGYITTYNDESAMFQLESFDD